MIAAIYIMVAIFAVILVLLVLMLYCAFEDVLKEYGDYVHQLQEHERKLDQEEINKQVMEVLHEHESMQKSDS